jgi:hypothetical protein
MLLGSFIKLNCRMRDSHIAVIPVKAGIQNRSMPQDDLPTETPVSRLSTE